MAVMVLNIMLPFVARIDTNRTYCQFSIVST